MSKNIVISRDDVLDLLDDYLDKKDGEWWSNFYKTRKDICFFTDAPDENLVELISNKIVTPPARVLELGCGKGRNAIYLSKNGFDVTAIDFSSTAIAEAQQKAITIEKKPDFICSSILTYTYNANVYDFLYDSACFHHIAPHRRPQYLELVRTRLKAGGLFGLTCFTPDGGSGLTDVQVYEERTLKGGLAFTEETLRTIFQRDFEILELRKMNKQAPGSQYFGEDFMWVMIMKKREDA